MHRYSTRAPRVLPPVNQPGDPFERSADLLAQNALLGNPQSGPLQSLTSGPAALDLESSGNLLQPHVRSDMERRFGHDFSRVRVHADSSAAASARATGTHAFTLGHDIVFGAGQYAPHTSAGRSLLAHELAHVVQQTGDAGGARPPAGVAQGKHLTIPEAVQAFTKGVDASAAAAPAGTVESIVETGQFHWTRQLGGGIRTVYNSVLGDPTWDPGERSGLLAGFDGILAAISGYDPKAQYAHTISVNKLLKASTHPRKGELQALLYDHSGLSGEDVSQRLWQFRNSKEMPPDLSKFTNIPMYDKVHAAEAVACGKTAGLAIQRFQQHGGFGVTNDDRTKDEKKLKGRFYSIGKGVKRHGEKDNNVTADVTYYMGDEVIYGGDLNSAINDIKHAIDAGFVVNARVVSGVGVSGPPRLHTEHSIVIIGYDDYVFVFWDPDSGASTMPASGFGYLFHSGNRFGTGGGDDQYFRVDAYGDHAGGGQHRYQIVTMIIT